MNAKYFQDILNEHGLVFRITDERQLFDTYKKSKDVAGILEALSSGYFYDKTGNRVLTYQIEFWGDNKDFDLFSEIIRDYFPNDTGEGEYYIYSQPLEFIEFAESGGKKKFVARVLFQIVEVVGGVSGKSTSIKVDGVEIDFTNVLYRQDKSLLPTKAFGNNKEVRMVSELLSIKIPMSDNAKNAELIKAGADNTYNKSYLVEWKFGGITKTFDAVLRVGIAEYPYTHAPILWTITFERALPRENWEISLWSDDNFWDVDEEYKPADEVHNEEITTESEFREFLSTIDKLDDVGYTVKNAYINEKLWQNLYTRAWRYEGVYDGYSPYVDDIYYDDNRDPITALNAMFLATDYNVGNRVLIYSSVTDTQYSFKCIAYGYTYNAHVYDETRDAVITQYTDFLSYVQFNLDDIDQDGYVVRVRSKIKTWEFMGHFETTNAIIDGYVVGSNSASVIGEEGFMVQLPDYGKHLSGYNTGDIYRTYDAGGTTDWKYLYAVVVETEFYWFAKLTVNGWVFYGKVVSGGQYGTPMKAPVIDYTAKHSIEVATKSNGLRVAGKPNTYSNAFSVLFLIDDITQMFLKDHYNQSKNKYQISYEIMGETYTFESMMISDIDRQNTENANQLMQVSFMEGW